MATPNHDYGASHLTEFVGQTELIERLMVEIDAVLFSTDEGYGDSFPHTLFFAFPGAGKTTLAKLIANFLGDQLTTLVMPVSTKVLERTLRDIDRPGILFLDEIHRASKSQQEELLTLMEEGYFQCSDGTRLDLTLSILAATTRKELLDDAVIDRFTLRPSFTAYSEEEMARIVETMARKAGVPLPGPTIKALGIAAGGTPRGARRLVLAARALYNAKDRIVPTVDAILHHAEVTEDGLTGDQVRYLTVLDRFADKTAGVSKIASALGVAASSVPEIERHLFDSGLIDYTDRGRTLTKDGRARAKELKNDDDD